MSVCVPGSGRPESVDGVTEAICGRVEGVVSRNYETFEELVEQSPFKDRFHRLGWVGPERLALIFKEANLGISVDQKLDAYQRFLQRYTPNFLTVREDKIHATYGTYMYPETYIINSKGKVVLKIPETPDSPATLDWTDTPLEGLNPTYVRTTPEPVIVNQIKKNPTKNTTSSTETNWVLLCSPNQSTAVFFNHFRNPALSRSALHALSFLNKKSNV